LIKHETSWAWRVFSGWNRRVALYISPKRSANVLLWAAVAGMVALLSGCDDINPNLGVQATQPTQIATLTPSAQRAGCPAFNLQVNGSGFSTNDTVQWATSVDAVPSSRVTTFVSDTLLTAAITAADVATAGTAVVNVNTAGQTQGNNLSNFVPFVIAPAGSGSCPNLTFTPNISGVSPTSGVVGTAITITGTNFGGTQGTSTVTFNGTQAPVTSWSATSIVVPVPVGATNGNLAVTVGGLASNSFFFVVAPNITSLSPTSGTTGSSVTITGVNFGNAQGSSTIAFNGALAAVTSWSSTSIVATVPAASATGPVVVEVSGVNSNGVTFTDLSEPIISSLNPGAAITGASVTIAGSNFGATQGSSTVTFNGTAATVTSWSAASIVTTVPAGATTGNVVVTVAGSPSAGTAFTVGPIITSLSVSSGLAGTTLTLNGTDFGVVQGNSTVTFGGTAAASITSWSNTIVDVTVPTVSSSTTTTNIVLTVVGLASPGVPFTVIVAPTINSLSPTSGLVGSSVSIAGTNFGSTQGASTVLFNAATATVTSWSAANIVATVPVGATTGNVTVIVSSAASNGVSFTVLPSVTSGPPLPCGTGNESVLKGPYAYYLQGFVGAGVGSPAARMGSFTADGTGRVIFGSGNTSDGGEEDLTVASGHVHHAILAAGSSYSVGSDNRGCLNLAYADGSSATFRFSVGSLSAVLYNGLYAEVLARGRVIEFDDNSGTGAGTRGSGLILRQDSTAFVGSALQANYAFGMDGKDVSGGHVGMAGTFTFNNATGIISSGYFDYNDAGSMPFGSTGTAGASTGSIAIGGIASGSGRTTGSFAAGIGGGTTYAFNWAVYIVNANQFLLLSTDTFGANTPIAAGQAIVTGAPGTFQASSLSGPYVDHVEGTSQGTANVTLLLLTATPSTNALAGTSWQYNVTSGFSSSTPSETYSVDPGSGRVTLTGATNPHIYYLDTSSTTLDEIAAFVLGTDSTAASGLLQVQTGTTIDDGSYSFGTSAPMDNTVVNASGVLQSTSSVVYGTADQSQRSGLTTAQISNITFTSNTDGSVTAPDGNGSTFLGVPDGPILFYFDESGPASINIGEQ